MTIEIGTLITVLINVAIIAGAWAHLVSRVASNAQKSDERHEDNVERLEEIRDRVNKINGSVREHDVMITRLSERSRLLTQFQHRLEQVDGDQE